MEFVILERRYNFKTRFGNIYKKKRGSKKKKDRKANMPRKVLTTLQV